MPTGSAGESVLYEEKLWPAPWIWMVVAGAAVASVFTFIPISIEAGIVAAVVVAAVLTTLLVLSTPRIRVTAAELQVGKAQIERRYLGDVTAFTGADATAQRGTELHGRAYLCIRGWISPVVRITIEDAEDPTPYWLTSTRRPEQLKAALTAPAQGG
ncbi:DUF3093 domain-containing protein [Arthrobacter sp. EH-1B-1]|uniref:DUF3093 domain-containing protein n=1 Tax=Arthrobacter vasquezii TaxID=2977629 RepID=A0ABT6CYI7_9MICC|nr:DUF3093 domain-containing protein [Arthrobacter vasquezii]MDF9279154.1 DUF3093 domain-containing protein [Arthrobacter vasquezii]